MHPVILLCDSPCEAKTLVEMLAVLGIEVQAINLEELSSGGVVRDTEAIAIAVKEKPSSKGIARFTGGILLDRRERHVSVGMIGHERNITMHALSIGRLAVRAQVLGIERLDPQPALDIEQARKALASFKEENLFLEKPKVSWPKAQHMKPAANWKHRPAAHPARSRDKRFMR